MVFTVVAQFLFYIMCPWRPVIRKNDSGLSKWRRTSSSLHSKGIDPPDNILLVQHAARSPSSAYKAELVFRKVLFVGDYLD